MAAHLMRAGRSPTGLSSDDVDGGLASQILAEHFSHCGTYRTEPDAVIHTVAVAAMPDWVGTEQRRQVGFQDNRLVLGAGEVRYKDQSGRAVLLWDRNRSCGGDS